MPAIPSKTLSPLARHRLNWESCTLCPLCEQRKKVCLVRGTVPCRILLIGEAPGDSEDVLGQPFVGPAGKLLDDIIAAAVPSHISYALTNVLGCMPKTDEGGKYRGELPKESVVACAPRLVEIARLCDPELVVLVGKEAQRFVPGQATLGYDTDRWIKFCSIVHPSAILQADESAKGLMVQRVIAALSDAVYDVEHPRQE